jgi:hypothetical protein
MKQVAEMDRIQQDMRPGRITLAGFLGNDRRLLIEILDADDAEVKRLGHTHATLAARMKALREQGLKGLGEAIPVGPHFLVRVESVRGRLPCPFHHAGVFSKINTTVSNLHNRRTITYTDLNIHMIERHGFYEGTESPFRLDPADLVTILEPPIPGD